MTPFELLLLLPACKITSCSKAHDCFLPACKITSCSKVHDCFLPACKITSCSKVHDCFLPACKITSCSKVHDCFLRAKFMTASCLRAKSLAAAKFMTALSALSRPSGEDTRASLLPLPLIRLRTGPAYTWSSHAISSLFTVASTGTRIQSW